MSNRKKVIAICGSTKANSSNLKLIYAIEKLASGKFEISVFRVYRFHSAISTRYLDNEAPPAAVAEFRNKLRNSDGILICTPEYAMGVPGSLKNAIDWTVSSMEFSQKPTALITASSLGQKGHASLIETLKIIEARITEETQLLISYINAKINSDGEITDENTTAAIIRLIDQLEILLDN